MKNQFIFPVKLENDEDGRFVTTFPDLPYGVTDGATREEALCEAADALDEVATFVSLDTPLTDHTAAN